MCSPRVNKIMYGTSLFSRAQFVRFSHLMTLDSRKITFCAR